VFLILGHAGVLRKLGVTSDYQVYEDEKTSGIFCLLDSATIDKADFDFGLGLECRLYSTQDPIVPSGFIELPASHILVSVAMSPNASSEKAFNDWYKEEHIPMLSRVPGWLASRRFNLISSTAKTPKYLALHAWVSMSVFERSEYEAAVDTPWRTEIIDQVIERERFVLKVQPAASEVEGT